MRRVVQFVIVAAATAGAISPGASASVGTTAPEAPKQANLSPGACSMYIVSRVAVTSPTKDIVVPFGANCREAEVRFASWGGYPPSLPDYAVMNFLGAPTDTATWRVNGTGPLGRWEWRPEGAAGPDWTQVYQYGPYSTDVRYGSYGRVTATRSGSKVNVRTSAMRYWGGGSRFIGWSDARGQIQWRTPGTNTWNGLKEVYSTTSGTYSYTYTTSASREYRVILRATPQIWESTSPTVRR